MNKLNDYQMDVYVELSQFAREVYDNSCTRYDLVSYSVGYYGQVNTEIWEVINRLFEEGACEA